MSNLYSKQCSRARGSVIYSVLYIDSAHNRANEIDVLPCLSFECWTNCKKGSMSVQFYICLLKIFVPNLDEIH